MKKVCAAALWAASCLAPPGSAREDFSAWKDSIRVFIDTSPSGAGLDEAVEDFPLLVRLDPAAVDFTKVKAGGADLRFADPDRTLLPHEIERFDAAARICLVWVRVPRVEAGSRTDHVILYWNNPAAVAAPKAAVFDTALGYAAVYHFGEEGPPFGGPGVFRDATPNGNHGDDFTTDPRLPSAIGYGQGFDGMDDRVQVQNRPSLALSGPLSLSAWVRADRYAAGMELSNPIVRKGDDLPISYQFGVMGGRAFLALDENPADVAWSQTILSPGAYYHLAGSWEGKTLRLFVNGELDAEVATTKSAGSLSKDARPMHIGGRAVNPFQPNSRDLWDGELDEVRVSRVARSAAHYRLAYAVEKPGSSAVTFSRFPAAGAEPQSLDDWPRSRRLFLNTSADGAAVAGAVDAFPLLVRLDSGLFAFPEAAPKGEDLRFSDPDGAVLPHAVERWDGPGRRAEIWVRVPRVEGGSRTDFIRMHWGMPKAPDTQDAAAVFDTADGFAGVWHLEAGAPGRQGAAAYKDQTAGRHHGQDFAAADAAAGLVGKGQAFGDGDRVKVPYSPAFDFPSALTFSAWIKGDAWASGDSDLNPILRKGEGNPNAYQLAVGNGRVKLGINADDARGVGSPVPLRTGLWYHVAATWQRGRIRVYVNGVPEADSATAWEAPAKDARALYLGGRDSSDAADQFRGLLDEVQAARVARSADWIKLAYESQRADARLVVHEGYEHRLPAVDTATAAQDPLRYRAARSPWSWDTTLAAGASLGTPGVFGLRNPGPDPLRVLIRPEASPDTFGATGVEASIRILSPEGDGTRALAIFSMDAAAAAGRSVYGLLPGEGRIGRLADLGPATGPVELLRAGAYVAGLDTLEPRLRLLREGVGDGDSTWAEFVAEDNLEQVNLKCFPSGAEGVTSMLRRERSGEPFRLAFKPADGLVPLKLFLSVDDGRRQSAFPPPPAAHHALSRVLPELRAPLAAKAGMRWDLVGLPVSPGGGLTLASLAASSGASALRAAVWDPALGDEGDYRLLAPADTLPGGAALWMAAREAFASLPLGRARTLPHGPASDYAVALRRGWNLVANPSLEPLPWVASPSVQPAYDLGAVKRLHAYAGDGAYRDADTLEPWKGYFVYAGADTVVRLTGRPPAAARRASPGTAAGVRLVLTAEPGPAGEAPAAAPVRLGAAAYAEDGLGSEDEPMPGAPARGAGVAAIREGRGLRTDLLQYGRGGPGGQGRILVWKLAWSGARGERPRSAAARFRLSELALPEGMSLWGATALRPAPAALAAGAEIGLEGDPADTLVLWAAPAGSWREGDPVPGLGPVPALRKAALARGAAGPELRLALPEASGVKAAWHAADGRRIGSWESPRLAPGLHAVPLAGRRGLPRGLILVTVDFEGAAGRSRQVLKALLP